MAKVCHLVDLWWQTVNQITFLTPGGKNLHKATCHLLLYEYKNVHLLKEENMIHAQH